MKKFLLFIGAAAIVCSTISSCSDDKDKDEPNVPDVKMVLVGLQGGYEEGPTPPVQLEVKYDSNGRVKEIRWDLDSDWEIYTYTDSKITCDNLSYTLNNGKIISDSDGYSYTYNSSNQVTKVTRGTSDSCSLIWKEGNVTSAEDNWGEDKEIYTLSYSDKTDIAALNYLAGWLFSTSYPSELSSVDWVLALGGYFGNISKNLCKEIYVDGSFDRSFEYSSYNEYGYPTVLDIIDSEGSKQHYILKWNKL